MDSRLVSQYTLRNEAIEPKIKHEEVVNPLAPVAGVDPIKWTPLRRIGQTVYPSDSPFGRPSAFCAGERRLYIGTHSADVLVLEYDQTLVGSARDSEHSSMGAVTALNVNVQETHIAAGHALGYVSVYSLENGPQLVYTVEPLQSAPLHAEAHLLGSMILHVAFQTHHSLTVYSTDSTGVVCIHKQRRTMLGVATVSQRLNGSYLRPSSVIAACAWPGYLVLLTESALTVFTSTELDFTSVLDIPHALNSTNTENATNSTNSAVAGIKGAVAYNHGRSELVYAVDNEVHFVQQLGTVFAARALFTHNHTVDQIAVVSKDCVLLRSENQVSFIAVADCTLLFSFALPPSSLEIAAVNSLILCMGRFEFYCGQLTSWSDRILALLNDENPARAVALACEYYTSHTDLQILGFPPQRNRRRLAVRTAFPDFLLTALKFALSFDATKLTKLVPEAVHAVLLIKPSMLLQVWELLVARDETQIQLQEQGADHQLQVSANDMSKQLFLDTLVGEIKQKRVTNLPAVVFRELILHTSDPMIYFNLDLHTLDIDLAFKVVKDDEVRIFLENEVLKDYISPLSTPLCAPYLAYILTGRIYPTGKPFKHEDDNDSTQKHGHVSATDAKMIIYTHLFLKPGNLQSVLDIDEVGVFKALNEAFEDPFLNENHEINRQIIVNMILSPELGLDLKTGSVYVFIAENYPKYTQFLLLPDTKLEFILNKLLEMRTREAQIALLSLLSVYKVPDTAEFVSKLIEQGYTIVLEHIFRRSNKLHELVRLKLNSREYEDVWKILSDALVTNFEETNRFMTSSDVFTELVHLNPEKLADLSVKFNLNLWSLVKESDSQFPFLKAYFDCIEKYGGSLPSVDICTIYVKHLCTDGPRLMNALEKLFTKEDDLSLPMLVDDMLANNRIDALALLMCRKDRKEEAMIYVANYIPTLTGEQNEKELERYVDIALGICLDVSKESLWKRLLETSVEMKNRKILQMIVHALSGAPGTDIVELVKGVLASPEKCSSVPIISLIYSDLTRQEETLRLFSEIIENENKSEVLEVMKKRLEGWTVPISSECQVCGNKIVGLGVDASLIYESWEKAMLNSIEVSNGQALVLFRCNHFYHMSCLSRMNGVDENMSRHCILCER